jgi:DNA polymerase-3 subunit delta'
LHDDSDEYPFEEWFVTWVRAALKPRGCSAIQDLILWSEKSKLRTRNTNFYNFVWKFRQALLLNYETPSLVYFEPKVDKFKLENFAPFVNGNNIHDIFKELSDAMYHVERNGNAKIILTDLSIKLTRLIKITTMNNVASILILVFLAISFIQSGMTNYFTGKII